MSMENLGPYSNFHELNQDWFLNEFNKVVTEWKAMQKNFDNLQDAFDDLKSYVMDYFKNLDVQDEINNKLDDMLLNGIFDNIIKSVLNQYMTFSGIMLINDSVSDDKFHCQGICVYKDYVYVATSANDNTSVIYQYSKNGTLLNQIEGEFFHCNSLCTNGLELYSLDALKYSGDNYITIGTISVFNANTLEFKKRIDTGLSNTTGIAYYNDEIYVLCTDGTIYSINNNNSILCKLDITGNGVSQGFTIYNNTIYYVKSNPNTILVYSINGEYYTSINIGKYIPNVYNLYEIEDISIDESGFYISNNDIDSNINGISRLNVLKGDVFTKYQPVYKYNSNYINTIYVNANNINNGNGNEDSPFNNILSALNLIKSLPSGKFNIKISGTVNGCQFESINGYDIRITGGTFNGLINILDGNITFVNSTFNCENLFNVIDNEYAKIYIHTTGTFASLCLYNCTFNNIPEDSSDKYIIRSLSSNIICTIYNSTYSGNSKLKHRFSGGMSKLYLYDKGVYIAPPDNYVYSYLATTIFKQYVGLNRHAYSSDEKLKTLAPNTEIDLTNIIGSIIEGSVIKIGTSQGTITFTYSQSKTGKNTFIYNYKNNSYIVSINISINNNKLTWTGIVNENGTNTILSESNFNNYNINLLFIEVL